MADYGQEEFIPSVSEIPSPAPRPTENFIPQREDPPAPPVTVGNYFTPEEAQRRFAQYLPIESTPNDVLMPSDDPRVYTYQMANGNIYHVPAYEEVLQERRSVGEAFNHLVDNFPSRTEVEDMMLGLPQAAYGAVSNMVTGQGTYEDVIGTATGMVGLRPLTRPRGEEPPTTPKAEEPNLWDGVDDNAVAADFEPIGDDPFEQQPLNPDEGNWDVPEDLDDVTVVGDGVRANAPLTGDWRVPPAPLREGKKMPTVPLYPPRDYTPNGYEPEDTIVFRSPVREFVAGVQIPAQGIKGSQFLKMLQDNPSIRNSEVSYLNLGISPEARYTREELQQLVDSRVPQIEAYFTEDFPTIQRQPVRDFEEDYKEIVISATPQDPSSDFRANSQHYDDNALAHARVSVRAPENGLASERYLLVEEMQSDLIQQGWREPVKRAPTGEVDFTLQDFLREQYPDAGSADIRYNTGAKVQEIIDSGPEDLLSGDMTMDSVARYVANNWPEGVEKPERYSEIYNAVTDYIDYNAVKNIRENEPTYTNPPIRTTQESTRLIAESLIPYAARMGVDEIVFPPLERIAAERFQVGSKDYQKAITPGSGFHQTYVTSLKKVLQELQTEFGRNSLPIYRRELPYKEDNLVPVSHFMAENDLDFINTNREYLEQNPTSFEYDAFRRVYGENFLAATTPDMLIESSREGPLLPTEGIAINIGGLRDQYNLQYPRFAEGGLVTQTRSAFGEIA
jgi:hypothetical protein